MTEFDHSSPLLGAECDPKKCGSDVLAFVGDGVFGLLVREYLASRSNAHAAQQHTSAVAMVRCESQAEYMKRILPLLSEEEEGVFRRGRNFHTSRSPRKSTADYHTATGLEALFGYLYLSGNIPRIRELFEYCISDTEG